MESLTLDEAAHFLKLHPEELRRRAKAGRIPAAKIGKCWVFLEVDLVDFLRSQYSSRVQALDKRLGKEGSLCHLLNEESTGGSILLRPMGNEYEKLLGLKTAPLRKSITITKKQSNGKSAD